MSSPNHADGNVCPVRPDHGRMYVLNDSSQYCPDQSHDRDGTQNLHPKGYVAPMPVENLPRAPERREEAPVKERAKKRGHFAVGMLDLLVAGLLQPGERLTFTYPGHTAEGIVSDEGKLLVNGVAYGSPSAAGAAIRGGAVNGWDHWAHREGEALVSLGALRQRMGEDRE